MTQESVFAQLTHDVETTLVWRYMTLKQRRFDLVCSLGGAKPSRTPRTLGNPVVRVIKYLFYGKFNDLLITLHSIVT